MILGTAPAKAATGAGRAAPQSADGGSGFAVELALASAGALGAGSESTTPQAAADAFAPTASAEPAAALPTAALPIAALPIAALPTVAVPAIALPVAAVPAPVPESALAQAFAAVVPGVAPAETPSAEPTTSAEPGEASAPNVPAEPVAPGASAFPAPVPLLAVASALVASAVVASETPTAEMPAPVPGAAADSAATTVSAPAPAAPAAETAQPGTTPASPLAPGAAHPGTSAGPGAGERTPQHVQQPAPIAVAAALTPTAAPALSPEALEAAATVRIVGARPAPAADAASPATPSPATEALTLPDAVSATAQAVRTEASAAAAAPQRTPAPPLAEQLAKPLFTLRTAPGGDHVMTLQVTPENLGPVTVRAHVGTDGIRIELIAPTDQAREALRGILSDLKRDLSTGGMPASLDLAAESGSGSGRDATPERRERSDDPRGAFRAATAQNAPVPAAAARAAADPSSRLDVVV